MSLAEFLLARIAEDEAAAMGWPDDIDPLAPDGHVWRDPQGRAIYAPKSRALSECEAKQRIIAEHSDADQCCPTCADNSSGDPYERGMHDAPCPTLRTLTLPYADHPDYRQEWKP